jgi:protein-tyrosine-phosphatase
MQIRSVTLMNLLRQLRSDAGERKDSLRALIKLIAATMEDNPRLLNQYDLDEQTTKRTLQQLHGFTLDLHLTQRLVEEADNGDYDHLIAELSQLEQFGTATASKKKAKRPLAVGPPVRFIEKLATTSGKRPLVISFVCHGNRYRSAFAHMITANAIKQSDLPILVQSAGTFGWQGSNKVEGIIATELAPAVSGLGAGAEKLLKAIATGDEKFLKMPGHLPDRHALTSDDLVRVYTCFDADDVLLRIEKLGKKSGCIVTPYILLTKQLSEILRRIDIHLLSTPFLSANSFAASVALEHGVHSDIALRHTPRTLTRTFIDRSDIILVADRNQYALIRDTFPHARKKTFMLGDCTARGWKSADITDPESGGFELIQQCFENVFNIVDGALLPTLRELKL